MIRCVVEMFGLPPEATELRTVEVQMEDKASLKDVIAALRREIPSLEGYVICPAEDRLTESYAFNINGRFYADDGEVQIRNGDRIALLILATGG
jgi:hypothetical protein